MRELLQAQSETAELDRHEGTQITTRLQLVEIFREERVVPVVVGRPVVNPGKQLTAEDLMVTGTATVRTAGAGRAGVGGRRCGRHVFKHPSMLQD